MYGTCTVILLLRIKSTKNERKNNTDIFGICACYSFAYFITFCVKIYEPVYIYMAIYDDEKNLAYNNFMGCDWHFDF